MYYEWTLLVLSFLAGLLLLAGALFPAEVKLFETLDHVILLIFGLDYVVRLVRAPRKGEFVLKNIPDLIAILPFDQLFRLARLARLARFFRFLRVLLFFRRFARSLAAVLKTNGLHIAMLVTFFIVLFGALGIYALEQGLNPRIHSFGDALWWSVVTTSTVGYGDVSPVTGAGKVLAGSLMILGIGFVGMVTGSIATYFVDRTVERQFDEAEQRAEAGQPQLPPMPIEGPSADLARFIQQRLNRADQLTEQDIDEITTVLALLRRRVRTL